MWRICSTTSILNHRIDVAEKDVLGVAIAFRQVRFEPGQHVEMEFDGIALIDILMIAAAPMKGVALLALDALDIDAALCKQIKMVLGKSSPMTPTTRTGAK